MSKKPSSFFLFSSWFMGGLFIILSLAMGVATFIEKDYGAETARQLVYETHWFEFIIALLAINLAGQIYRYRLYRLKKITIGLFHFAFLVIILGAALTRYTGEEGMMHIREGKKKNYYTSVDNYLFYQITNNNNEKLASGTQKLDVTPLHSDQLQKNIEIANTSIKLRLHQYIPNASPEIQDTRNGQPLIHFSVAKKNKQPQSQVLSPGKEIQIEDLTLSFRKNPSADIVFDFVDDHFTVHSRLDSIKEVSMASSASKDIPPSRLHKLRTGMLYNYNDWQIVIRRMYPSAVIAPRPLHPSTQQTGQAALVFQVSLKNTTRNLYLWKGNSLSDDTARTQIENYKISLNYGPKKQQLPFEIQLKEFILERYPGSNSPSSYRSEVQVIDEKQSKNFAFSIYMNHILKHQGYRFYQSSYDQDEQGTILSVNHDKYGIIVTYTGYAMMIVFILLSLINPSSRFRTISSNYWKKAKKPLATVLLFGIGLASSAAEDFSAPPKKVSNNFGEILVQDNKGRTKPLHTLSHDILRKIHKNASFNGYSPMQVFLGYYFHFEEWKEAPVIQIPGDKLKKELGFTNKYVAFTDLVNLENNSYILAPYIDQAYSKPPNARSKLDKDVIKLDERLNICFMIYSGDFLKIMPLKDQPTKWGTPQEALLQTRSKEDSLYIKNIMALIHQGIRDNNIPQTNSYINSIKNYQAKFSDYPLPNEVKIKAEILYYKLGIFEFLFPYLSLLGLVYMILLILKMLSDRKKLHTILKAIRILIFIGFLAQTAGLALRWYIAGHAPLSNGYESMLFVSWVTLLAGILFHRRSQLALAATGILAGFTLMVAHLSFMDPEITNLVPVLKSYWLTLHVSIITGSYGFLGMSAILGILIMAIYALMSEKVVGKFREHIKELTAINYKSLTIGLYMLTIGTFLGAIWANESWGRYWGWDPKETWSLITILIYSFVLHSRMIPGFQSRYAFNLLSIIAFASVLMTYFGVNYYLTGLHSYAGGEAISVPFLVYFSILVLTGLAIMAFKRGGKTEKELTIDN